MYSPKIDENYIPAIYKLAKKQNTPMTKIVNEAIKAYLFKSLCRNCLSVIDTDEPQKTAYCDFCDSEVFLIKPQ